MDYKAYSQETKGHPLDSKFLYLLRDFTPKENWEQFAFIKKEPLKALLRGLADFHAHFWLLGAGGEVKHVSSTTDKLFKPAGYWDLAK